LQPPSGFVNTLAEANDLRLEKPNTAAERRLFKQLDTCTGASLAAPHKEAMQAQDCRHGGLDKRSSHGGETADSVGPTPAGNLAVHPVSSAVLQASKETQHKSSSHNMQSASKSKALGVQGKDWARYRCQYTRIPATVHDTTSASPAELTAANMDKSPLLGKLFLSHPPGAHRLLAELQFSFMTFLVGKSLKGVCALATKCVI
jgi:hypothetical protein